MPPPKRNDPYNAFNFIIDFGGSPIAGFSECSGLSSETTVIEYREGSDKVEQRAQACRPAQV